jgi:ParB/RepB/Spo0J family partition protein
VGFFKPDSKNPRTSYDEGEIDRLGDDMLARGVLVPLLARPDGTIIDGWRRWLAAQRKGIKELPVIITDKPENEIRGIQLATVFHRADLTGHEKWLACSELMCMNPKWQLKDLAEFLHLGAPAITKILSVSKCSLPWHEALAAGRVSIGDCYAAASLPEADQAALLSQKLAGASRDDIVRAARRKNRDGNTPSGKVTRMNRIVCPLVSGVSITVSGEKLSLESLIDAFSEARKAAITARDQGLDIRTLAAVLKDKAKAGK